MWSTRGREPYAEPTRWSKRFVQGAAFVNLGAMAFLIYFLSSKRIDAIESEGGSELARIMVYISAALFALLVLVILYFFGWAVPIEHEVKGVAFQWTVIAALVMMALSYAV